MKKMIGALLIAATALTPLAVAHGQSDVRERGQERRVDGEERAPRGPEVRQMDRREMQRLFHRPWVT
ncbi:MAG: hypothetical protein HC788_10580, partial [Sphingopyxis sp.]|nr:hypothetical protein [Sphingopyxis sp.]